MTNTIENDSLTPQIVRAEDGDWYGAGPETARTILSGAQTGGAFALIEARVDAPGYGPPYHVHTREDETFTVLEGSMTVVVDGTRHELKAGDAVFAPRGIPHTWISGPNGVRMTILTDGGNFERAYGRIQAALAAGEAHRLPEIVADHGIAFLPER